METSEVGTIFALPWLITWFGHVLPDYNDVVRLYDFFLAQPPMMAVYLAAAIVLHRSSDVKKVDCDMPSVHGLLSGIPLESPPFEYLLKKANELYDHCPPESIENDVRDRMKKIEEAMKPKKRQAKENFVLKKNKTENKTQDHPKKFSICHGTSFNWCFPVPFCSKPIHMIIHMHLLHYCPTLLQ